MLKFSAHITISLCVEWPKISHQQGWRSKWVNPSSPTQPCWVKIRLDHILWWAEQHDLIWNMYHAELMCKHTETGKHSTSWEIDGIRWWCPSWFNVTWHDTYDWEFNILMVDMNPWQHPPPEIQRLVVQMTYNQDTKTYAHYHTNHYHLEN